MPSEYRILAAQGCHCDEYTRHPRRSREESSCLSHSRHCGHRHGAIAGQSSSGQVTVIRAGTLIDGKSDTPRRDQVIVIRGNRIESVSDAASAKIPAGAQRHRSLQATVLPGLIDSHTHIFLQGEDPPRADTTPTS